MYKEVYTSNKRKQEKNIYIYTHIIPRIEISDFIGDISLIYRISDGPDFEYQLLNGRNFKKISSKYRQYIGLEQINWRLNRP